jgi:glyoxylase-like metal-dependent hydrolase (beta-lactamase superfamily II)
MNLSRQMIKIESYDGVQSINLSITFLGKEIFPINSYAVGNLLIDTGPASMSKEFLKVVESFNIKTVVNTHAHSDHIGSNYAFPFVFVHPAGFERLRNPKVEMPIERIMFGLPKPSNPKKIPKIIEDYYRFNVLYTPGHSPDHISLYEPNQKWAFTGDLLLWGSTREVFTDVKIYDAMESLRKLANLKIERLFPGHGPPFEKPNEALREQIKNLEVFEMQIKELHQKGWNSQKIRNEIFGKERLYTYLFGGKFSALNLVNSYIERLKKVQT